MDVGLELDDRLGGEGVGDDLALARVLGTVARVEEAALDADEGVVEGAGTGVRVSIGRCDGAGIRDTDDFRNPLPWP